MAQKTVNLPGIGDVILAKRQGTRNLRLSIAPDGKIRVGMPYWAPYSAGISFALSRQDWIEKHKPARASSFSDGQRVGKSYRLIFVNNDSVLKTRSRIVNNQIVITSALDISNATVQKTAAAACERALKKDAQALLPQRLKHLADRHVFSYKSVRIKRLRSRWGSCSSDKVITLNYYLIQLPWELIDYVILHELTHTTHLNHSKEFWDRLAALLPDIKRLRREIKAHKPVIAPQALA